MFSPAGSKIKIRPLNVVPDLEVLQWGGREVSRKLLERVVMVLLGAQTVLGASVGAPAEARWNTG